MRPRPRIAHCGTLMIGVKASMPKAPRLLIVNVPPREFLRTAAAPALGPRLQVG